MGEGSFNWKTAGIAALGGGAAGALVGSFAGPGGAAAGLLLGAVAGGAIGGLVGKKHTNPGLPLYVNGKESPDDLYDLLWQIYLDNEAYNHYTTEQALPPDFIFPRESASYIIQRYGNGTLPSRYHSRGYILSIDSISLFCSLLGDYESRLCYLEAIPLTLLAVEYYFENNVSDEQLMYVLEKLREKNETPHLYEEGLYRELEYQIVLSIAESVKLYTSPKKITYFALLNAILNNHNMSLRFYLEQTTDEMFLDEKMMNYFNMNEEERLLFK